MGSCTDKEQNLRTRTARMDLDFSRLMALSARWNKLDIVAQIQHRTSKCKVVQSRGTTIYELANIIILVKTVKVEQEYCSPLNIINMLDKAFTSNCWLLLPSPCFYNNNNHTCCEKKFSV